MANHTTPKQQVDIINRYTVDLVSAQDLASEHGITRQGVHKILRRHGIKPANYERLQVSCTACGAEVSRPRCQVRARRHIFCSQDCYYAWLEGSQGGTYEGWRQGQRVARLMVQSCGFDLKPGHVVHHKDRNTKNNEISNLLVFANQGDHIRFHRWGDQNITVPVLFDGSHYEG